MNAKALYIAAAAFIVPIVGIVVLRHDDIQQMSEIDPKQVRGQVLYFYSPG